MPKAPVLSDDLWHIGDTMRTRQGFERATRGGRNADRAETRAAGAWGTMRALSAADGVRAPRIPGHLHRIELTRQAFTDSPAIRAPDPV